MITYVKKKEFDTSSSLAFTIKRDTGLMKTQHGEVLCSMTKYSFLLAI